MKETITVILMGTIIISIMVGGWFLYRKVHYKFAYESMVEKTIRNSVKSECLK